MAVSFEGDDVRQGVPENLENLVAPHIDSFDYFVERGLPEAVRLIRPVEAGTTYIPFPHFPPFPLPAALLPPRLSHTSAARRAPPTGATSESTSFPPSPTPLHPPFLPSSPSSLSHQCRQAGTTYRGDFRIDLCVSYFDEDDDVALADVAKGPMQRQQLSLGRVPIMVKSGSCHLRHLTQEQLVRRKEESIELGGYFICNGIERLIRLLIAPRRNYVMNLRRPTLLKKGLNFSDMATTIRCVRTDQSAVTNRVVYVNDGNACFNFSLRKQEYFIPVGIILKCLVDVSDAELLSSSFGLPGFLSIYLPASHPSVIPCNLPSQCLVDVSDAELYEHLTAILTAQQAAADPPESDTQLTATEGGVEAATKPAAAAAAAAAAGLGTQFVRERALVVLSHPRSLGLFTRMECLAFLGKTFRPAVNVPSYKSDAYVGQQIIADLVLVHLDKPMDKLRLLVFMLHKLWSMVDGLSQEDSMDTLMHHELYLPGHILNIFIKEKLQVHLHKIQAHAAQELVDNPTTTDLRASNWLRRLVEGGRPGAAGAAPAGGLSMTFIGKDIEYMLNTGNLASPSGLDMQQRSGFTVVADKLNWHRYLSHFRSVHRGAFFSTLRTTTSPSGLDMSQKSGFTVVADKLNWHRYLSHFRSVHRGAFFSTLRTTTSPSGLDMSQKSGFTVVADKLNWHRYLSHFRSVHRGAFFSTLRTTTSPSGLDMSQKSGFTVVADKLNWHRYLSHFRSVHRGAFFSTLRTTTSPSGLDMSQKSGFTVVADKLNWHRYLSHFRQEGVSPICAQVAPKVSAPAALAMPHIFVSPSLLPRFLTFTPSMAGRGWGFVCPVHTPDGAPCGLLTHLSAPCTVTANLNPPSLFSTHPVSSHGRSWGFVCPVHTPDGAPCGLLTHLSAPCTVTTDLTPPPLASPSPSAPSSSLALLPSTPGSALVPHTPSTTAGTPGAASLASGLGSGVGSVKSRDAIGRAVLRCLAPFGLAAVGAGVPPPAPPPVFLTVMVDGCLLGHIHSEMAPAAVKHLSSVGLVAVSLTVMVDGCVMGHIHSEMAPAGIPRDLEVAFIPFSQQGTFPGIFLFSAPARFVRPVRQLPSLNPRAAAAPTFELIGSLEQVFLDVLCPDGSSAPSAPSGQASATGSATHEEVRPTDILSVMANLTPWSDYNQSPRNMYQCQMGKQTMGMPLHSFPFRNDNKLYRLQTPQTPIARTAAYDDYAMDQYPTGANAVVAVLAYTGYDMEDAMIINKSSMERGFGHGYIYKNEVIEATQGSASRVAKFTPSGLPVQMLGRAASHRRGHKWTIDTDGLPRPGEHITSGDVYACKVNTVTGKADEIKLKGSEDAVVDGVTLIGTGAKTALTKASVRMRFGRLPQIGDKFSSRHGQKGVLSQLWPDVDMPFASSSGMRPDIIINPHAFPSRMTIGMLVESVAAKGGALHGNFVDASPFRPATSNPPPLTMSLKSRQPAQRRGASRLARSSAGTPGLSTPVPRSKLHKKSGAPPTPATPVTPAAAAGAEKGPGSFTPLDLPTPSSSAKPGQAAKPAAGPAAAGRAGESNQPQNREDLVDTFGRQLVEKGFSYYGTETMYSGVYGCEMECEIYLGVVYYQRLRHMVSDKFQVRSTGPVNPLTQQPVKGRKKGGGVRFGEMERDAMLSHGAAFLLHDRLHSCSDYHTTDVCSLCGSLLAPALSRPRGGSAGVVRVAMPYVFKYLAAELAAMNIKLTLGV
ncbi:unnamed protein product [Closterium sp. Naga37s-1]|nr:unnamed protein product [Closterium sp. Naga37s-1]